MIVGIVIRTPGDLCDIKVAGQTEIPAEPTQFASLRGNLLHVGAETVDLLPVLTEARVCTCLLYTSWPQ